MQENNMENIKKEKLDIDKAREFAEENFEKMDELNYQWNILHIKYMIKALEELTEGKDMDSDRLKALAWVHDIGKIKSEEDHASLSVDILSSEFDLDDIDRDCIINHGGSGNPATEEGRIFQTADGISLFYPEIMLFRFYAEAKEGSGFEKVLESVKKQYEKYCDKYSDRPEAVEILKEKFEKLFGEYN